jgi:hypothetical protein
MHFVENKFIRRGDADQKGEMRGEKQDDGDDGGARGRRNGNGR